VTDIGERVFYHVPFFVSFSQKVVKNRKRVAKFVTFVYGIGDTLPNETDIE
jgi:hypothetical protein